jgi:hypothetical protein
MHWPAIFEGAVKLLAVVGGAALGALAVGLVLRFCGIWLGAGKAPRRLGWLLRALGGIAGGWLVWLFVMGPGGSGLLGGGGSLFGGRGTGPDSGRVVASPPTHSAEPLSSARTPPAGSVAVSVTMLGGKRVVDSRFYLLEGAAEPMTLNELKQAIKERRQQNPAVRVIEIKIYQDSVSSNHPAVKDLEQWAMDTGFTVSRPPPVDRDLP